MGTRLGAPTATETRYAVELAIAASINDSFSRSLLYGSSRAKRSPVSGVLKAAEKPAATPIISAFPESIRRRSTLFSQLEKPPEMTVEGPSGPAEPPKIEVATPDAVLTIASRGIMPLGVRWKTSSIMWKLLLGVLYHARRWTRK